MREVDVDAKVLGEIDRLEPAPHAFKTRKSSADGIQRHAQREADGGCAERVVDIEAGGHVQSDLRFAERGFHAKARTRTGDAQVEWMQIRRRCQTVGPATCDRPAKGARSLRRPDSK